MHGGGGRTRDIECVLRAGSVCALAMHRCRCVASALVQVGHMHEWKHPCRWATCMNGEVRAAATSCCRCVRLARPRCTAQPVNGLYVGAGARPGRHQHGQTDTGTHTRARAHAQGVRACASAAFATTGARAASAQEDGGEGGEREGARLETSGSRTAGRLELSAGCGGADSGSDMVRAALSLEPSILPLFPALLIFRRGLVTTVTRRLQHHGVEAGGRTARRRRSNRAASSKRGECSSRRICRAWRPPGQHSFEAISLGHCPAAAVAAQIPR